MPLQTSRWAIGPGLPRMLPEKTSREGCKRRRSWPPQSTRWKLSTRFPCALHSSAKPALSATRGQVRLLEPVSVLRGSIVHRVLEILPRPQKECLWMARAASAAWSAFPGNSHLSPTLLPATRAQPEHRVQTSERRLRSFAPPALSGSRRWEKEAPARSPANRVLLGPGRPGVGLRTSPPVNPAQRVESVWSAPAMSPKESSVRKDIFAGRARRLSSRQPSAVMTASSVGTPPRPTACTAIFALPASTALRRQPTSIDTSSGARWASIARKEPVPAQT
mmetsp:Transcript_75115/g.179349  ORF Transcript_75115/g.179349 Transcript_75115/m.179349 type:complete len:278 (-) Transcript_75115:253-1086(-)